MSLVALTSTAVADEPAHHVSIGAAIKHDARNPLAGSVPLYHLPLTVGLGHALGPDLALEVQGGVGIVNQFTEGGGWFAEASGRIRWLPFRRGVLRAGLGLGGGWTRTVFENKDIEVTTNGLHLEPSLELEVRVAARLSIGLAVRGRVEHLVGDARYLDLDSGTTDARAPRDGFDTPQYGGGGALDLRYRF